MANELTPHLKALERAKAAGDEEAVAVIRQNLIEAQRAMDRQEYSPVDGNSFGQNLREGVGQGMMNVARHAGNLVGLVPDESLEEFKALDAPLMGTAGGRIGSMIGETAAFAPLGGGVVSGASRLGAAALTRGVGRGVLEGATQGLVMADPGEKGAGAILGGAVGGALPAGFQAFKTARSGVRPTREARRLMQEGVDLTPGQMNPRGIMGHLEQAAMGVPGLRTFVGGARERAGEQFNRAMVENAMPPGGTLARQTTDANALVDDAAHAFDAAYDVVKGYPVGAKIMRTSADVPLSDVFAQITAKPRLGLTESARTEINDALQSQLRELLSAAKRGGGMMSEDLMGFRSMIRQAIRDEALDTAESRARAALLKDAEKSVTEAIESQIDPAAAKALRAIDAKYGDFAVVRSAVAKAKDRPGGPTPFNFSQAVFESTPKNIYARGGGRMRDLAAAGRATFEQTVPQTGLTGWGTLGLGGLAAANAPQVMIPLAAAGAGLIGTRTGRRLAAGATRPQLLARQLERDIRRALPAREVRLGNKSLGKLNPREVAALYARALTVAADRNRAARQ